MVNWKMVAEGECLSTASRHQAGFLPRVCVWEQREPGCLRGSFGRCGCSGFLSFSIPHTMSWELSFPPPLSN